MIARLPKFGFNYLAEVLRDVRLDDNGIYVPGTGYVDHDETEIVHNLMPTEGLDNLLGVNFKGSAATANWYIGVYEGNYTPLPTNTAATFPGLATECTTYAESTRILMVSGAVAAGAFDNSASPALFTFNATKTIYGGFITSAPTKGATTGKLASAVRFASSKAMDSSSILRVTAGFTVTST